MAQLARDKSSRTGEARLPSAGRMTGFVAGMEEWLSGRLPRVTPAELEARARFFSRELASHGVTAFTDATVRNGLDEVTAFAKLVSTKAIGQRTSVMVGQDHIAAVPDARRIADTAGLPHTRVPI